MRASILLAILLLAACASSMHDSDNDADGFRAAAVSWVGAPVDEMLAVWGEPNRQVIDAKPDREGMVRWRVAHRHGSNAPGMNFSELCDVEARYGIDRIITRVDTISYGCEKMLAESLDNLTRRAQ